MKAIKVDMRSTKSISRGERLKSLYENKGYTLVKTLTGFNTFTLFYRDLNNG